MQGLGIKILREAEKKGELSLDAVSKLIPAKHNDHRDFLILASLNATGFLVDGMLETNKTDPNNKNIQLLARQYFACSKAEGNHAEYENWSWSGGIKELNFALSGEGSLYLSERRSKRFDRIFTLASGMLVGIIVASVSAYFRGDIAS